MTKLFRVQVLGFITLVRKEVVRVFRIWTQTLLPSVITTTLYFLVFGSFIGERIGDFSGVPYINFILPGLIMMSMITNAYANVVSSLFGAKFQKNIEELLVSPLSSATILLGFMSGGVVRSILVGCLVITVSLFFTPLSLLHPFLVLSTMILTSVFFSLAGVLNAIFAKRFDDISIIPTFVLTPLTYLGGVFYSIEVLPEFWQKVSLFNPILYLVNMFRYGFLGISDIPVYTSLLVLGALVLCLWSLCLYLLKKGVGIRH